MEKKYKNILPELTEYIGTARYDKDGTIIWAAKGEELQHLADVRGWGHLQNKFPTEQDAMFFQDAIGEFIADAINEKLQRASIPEMPQVDLGEVEKLVQKVANNNAESVKSYYQKSQADIDNYAEKMRSRIGYSISDSLTSPPTKTE